MSILISVRNEEKHIPILLHQLDQLDYPTDKLQILIGDDSSTDDTWNLLKKNKHSFIECVRISTVKSQLKGKMNVLAQLSEKATGEYLIYTDADVVLDPLWAKAHVSAYENNVNIVGGITVVSGECVFHKLQNIDLILHQGMLKVLGDLGSTISMMGNNLSFSKIKFDEIGGYDGMPFSAVEDVALINKVVKNGGHGIIFHTNELKVETNGQKSLSALFSQRMRWSQAISFIPTWLRLLFIVKLLFVPATFYLIALNPNFSFLLLIQIILVAILSNQVAKRIKFKLSWWQAVVYNFIEPIFYFSLLLVKLLPLNLKWKERTY